MTSRWNNPTGGIAYHLQALRRRGTLWAPCVRGIARFLAEWAPPEPTIVLVGPSGGHCLDPSFLQRFTRIVAEALHLPRTACASCRPPNFHAAVSFAGSTRGGGGRNLARFVQSSRDGPVLGVCL